MNQQKKTFLLKEFNTPSISNCWMITELTDGKVTAAWGFKTIEDAKKFDLVKLGRCKRKPKLKRL